MLEESNSTLLALKSAQSLRSFAPLVDFTPSGLAYTLYKIPQKDQYHTFSIAKKNGGERIISAPTARLKLLQRNLAALLTQCFDEISASTQASRTVSHGFRRDHSIVTNAREHRRKKYVLNLDLEDFFDSINFGRVRGFFIADRHFSLEPAVATVIAQIACHDNMLPQGAPTSPIISNFIGQILDTRLTRLAKRYGCHYTRYADDLTFSTKARYFPVELCIQRTDRANVWQLGDELRECIERSGFLINDTKTRMQIVGSRQETTGLIVNEKINVKPEYYRTVRSMCHSLFKSGSYFVSANHSEDNEGPLLLNHLAPLEGRLSFIYYVKDRRDLDSTTKREMKFSRPFGFEKLYRKFLIYKYFVASDLPVVITEGKTDIVYLSCAMQSFVDDFPALMMHKDGAKEKLIRFVYPSYINTRILNLGEGIGGMKDIFSRYSKMISGYHIQAPYSPVIFVVDNDSGGKSLFKEIKSKNKMDISFGSADSFFHLGNNLYLVKTPSEGQEESNMEDLFDSELLSEKINGKPFDRRKAHGDGSSYGKAEFADRIVRPRKMEIDFSQFRPMLEGISSAISHYHNQIAMAGKGDGGPTDDSQSIGQQSFTG